MRSAIASLVCLLGACSAEPAGPANPFDHPGGKGDGENNACPAVPPRAEHKPPVAAGAACGYMDYGLSEDGFYVLSQFGSLMDGTTLGRNTSCGALQTHYAGQCCMFDIDTWKCLDADATGARKQRRFLAPRGDGPTECHPEDIPETGPPFFDVLRTSDWWYRRRTVDFDYWRIKREILAYFFTGDGAAKPAAETRAFAHPEYFYVAGAQRFGCDAYLRVSNPATGRCIVAFADDGGPGSRWEDQYHAGRHILDASPALQFFLGATHLGWKNGDLVYVEWAQPGDEPGQPCTPCSGRAAAAGSEALRSPFDLVQGFRGLRACRADSLTATHGVSGGSDVRFVSELPDAGPTPATDGGVP